MATVTYQIEPGEDYDYTVLRAREVASANDVPALYAWYLRSPLKHAAEDKCDPYRRVFSARRFSVQADAPLGEKLIGRVRRQQAALPTSGYALDEPFFAHAFAVFAPPIYIGRSREVRTRLLAHLRAVETALSTYVPPVAVADPDSDAESKQFGGRVGALLAGRGIRDTEGLYVKVVYAPSNDATKRAETILNRTFHPILGRN